MVILLIWRIRVCKYDERGISQSQWKDYTIDDC